MRGPMSKYPLSNVPLPALVLGLGGLIPFMAGSAAFWALYESEAFWAWKAFEAQLFYGAAILSFLGAVHWGAALKDAAEDPALWLRLSWGVVPSLLAWLASLMNPAPAVLTLIVGVAAAYFMDLRARDQGWFPNWYLDLRKVLTLGVLLCLGMSLARLAII